MTILAQLKADYARFPERQSYDLYASDVYFKDPMTQFRGVKRYKQMIGFIKTYFLDVEMELHDISQTDNTIQTQWTLSWIAPFPWRPSMSISGRSELVLDQKGLVCSHIDYWDCSRWAVLKQVFS